MGVIHDDDVQNVNRKTTARNSTAQQFRFSKLQRLGKPTALSAAWKI
jgi:hypothetical protein